MRFRWGMSKGVRIAAVAAGVVVAAGAAAGAVVAAGSGSAVASRGAHSSSRGAGPVPVTRAIAPTPAQPAVRVPARPNGLEPFRRAWVAVPVATVWNHPATARPEDAPAVSSKPDVNLWLTTLAYPQKLGLDDLLATQALLDQPVFVYGHQGGWDHVLVLGQTGSVYPLGIAGWVPAGQITFAAPPATRLRAAVDVPVLRVGGLALSYGTELPVSSYTATEMTVVLPNGLFTVPSGDLSVGALARSGPAVVAQAERFLGLPYLWAGTSSFGYDCSGLTYSVYKRFGVVLARDAADQAIGGVPVARPDLAPGDLVFFAFGPTIDHVGIYAGDGMMVDAPHTGAAVEVVPVWGSGRARFYAGARRYL